jgi:hypothetical protein
VYQLAIGAGGTGARAFRSPTNSRALFIRRVNVNKADELSGKHREERPLLAIVHESVREYKTSLA